MAICFFSTLVGPMMMVAWTGLKVFIIAFILMLVFPLPLTLLGDLMRSVVRWLRNSAAGLDHPRYDVPLHTSHEHR